MHENYDSPVHLAHDIELLKLKTPATLGAVWGSYASQTWYLIQAGEDYHLVDLNHIPFRKRQ